MSSKQQGNSGEGFHIKEISIKKQSRTRIRPAWPLRRKLRVWLYINVVPPIGYVLMRLLNATFRWRLHIHPEVAELIQSGQPLVGAFWHTDLIMVQAVACHLGLRKRGVVMISPSQTGELEARILKFFGYKVIRGSHKERGREALEEMMDALKQGAIAIFAVDGPRGPAGVVKPGALYLAKNGGAPLLCAGFLTSAEWRLKTWDATRIPKPFARCVFVVGEPVRIPKDAGQEVFDALPVEVAQAINSAEQAEISWEQAGSTQVLMAE